MKTLSGTSKLVILAAIVAVAVLTFRTFAQSPSPEPEKKFVLNITKTDEVKSETQFKNVLKNLGERAIYKIDMVHNEGGEPEHLSGGSKLGLKTDKVTTSEVARSASAGELTSIGIHVTQQVASNDPADIIAVLNALK
jgi:hypothetical protein